MPKSLDTGVSAIVPIKTPAKEKEALQAVLDDGETISGLTRELWKKEVKKRTKKAKKMFLSVLCWTKKNKHGWTVDLRDSKTSRTLDQFEHEGDAWAFAKEYAAEHGLEIKL